MKEEITKEVKKIEDLEDKPEEPETTPEEELEESQEEEAETEEEPKEETIKEKPKLDKKKIIIIASVAAAILILIIVILCLTLGKKKEVRPKQQDSGESAFVTTLNASLESGEFDKEIQKGLKENGIKANSVTVISLDIDSDDMQEIVVYAEENKQAILLSLEVEEDIVYDESYPIEGNDALGYAYSSERRENLWYILDKENVVIVSDTKKIIKLEDFRENYVGLAYKYKNELIIKNGIEYKFNKQLDAKKLEKEALTGELVLKNNKIKPDETKDIYDNYKKEKEETAAKEKEEAEKKAKEEEYERKTQGTLKLGNINYRYGRYTLYNTDSEDIGEVILYSDLTCSVKGQSCTFTVGEVRDANDDLVPGIALSTGHMFITTVDEGVMVDPSTSNLLKYVG